MNKLRINYESDLKNPVPGVRMRELLDQNLYSCVADAVLAFLGDCGEVGFQEDDFILETALSEEQFIEKASRHDFFRELGVKIKSSR